MVIFLYGSDDYRREEKKRQIIEEFKKKNPDIGLGYFDLSELSSAKASDGQGRNEFDNFCDFIRSRSIFAGKRLAVLRGVFDIPKEKIVPQLKLILEEKAVTVLISEGGRVLKDFKFLEKEPVLTQKFEILKNEKWRAFVDKEARKRKIKLDSSAMNFLASAYNGDSWRLATELDRLEFLRDLKSERRINIKDLEKLGVEQASNFWSLLWGFKNRDITQRLWALEKALGTGESATKMFNILAYQMPDKKTAVALKDLAVKSGKLEYEEALLDLVLG